jgi:Phage integrase family
MQVSSVTPLGTQRLLTWAPLARSPTRDYREAVRTSQPRDSEREGRSGWHDLQHTYSSHLAMRGVPLKVIQELIGHATIDMMMRYAHLSPDTRREVVVVLDRPFAPACDIRATRMEEAATIRKDAVKKWRRRESNP